MQFGQKYINETAKLDPPHSFVPWVVVNNQPIGKVCLFSFLISLSMLFQGFDLSFKVLISVICNMHHLHYIWIQIKVWDIVHI